MPTVPYVSRKSTKNRASIKFGSWLRLYSEDQLLAELAPFNLTRATFRHLLANLCVPSLHIGKLRFVDGYSFFLALRAVLSIGEPDFYAPNCNAVYFRNTNASKLDIDRFRRNQKRLTADLLYSKRFNGMTLTDAEIRKTARLAFDTEHAIGEKQRRLGHAHLHGVLVLLREERPEDLGDGAARVDLERRAIEAALA